MSRLRRAALPAPLRCAMLAVLVMRRTLAKPFEMNGLCAAVVKEQKWLQEDLHGESLANWDYKVKVEPWTVFGQVHVHLMGSAMQLQHVYGGTAPMGGSAFTVALDPVPLGDDSMFEISGFGIPGADPEFSCSNLHKVRTVGRRQSRTGHVSRLKESCVSLWRRTTTRRAVQWDCTSD